MQIFQHGSYPLGVFIIFANGCLSGYFVKNASFEMVTVVTAAI
ncbi:hypothetical protein A8990_102179 [Paenibacillus taihuensis]|uniref:Uncharacterized protein n=1 Tax=Paenibacillus taihuensis TaxID=1156355 RepID=A0A3D9SJN7_9BACL|nr:hypothetical protein A8990_102179 [Paenibacillus taihuensis]